jgi:hypothetical protein
MKYCKNWQCLGVCLILWGMIHSRILAVSLPIIPADIYQQINIKQTESHWNNADLQIRNNQLILSPQLQAKLKTEIEKAKRELAALSQELSLNFTEELGIVYFHQGRDYWLVKFTYGGMILEGYDDILLPIRQIFALKDTFEQTTCLTIENNNYPTNGYMRQLGPILHEET